MILTTGLRVWNENGEEFSPFDDTKVKLLGAKQVLYTPDKENVIESLSYEIPEGAFRIFFSNSIPTNFNHQQIQLPLNIWETTEGISWCFYRDGGTVDGVFSNHVIYFGYV